jgi:hypothetical protein
MNVDELPHHPKDISKLLLGSLKLLTLIIGAIYLIYFLYWLLKRFLSFGSENQAGAITNSPKFFILLAILIVIGGFMISRTKQLLFALVGFLFVLLQFVLWYRSTQQIKLNTGLDVIPGNGPSNLLIGAGYIDLVIFVAAILCLGLTVITMLLGHKFRRDLKQTSAS